MKVKSESGVAQSCPTLSRPHGLQPTRLLCPWDFPGKSTGMGCHCLLQSSVYVFIYINKIVSVNPVSQTLLVTCIFLCVLLAAAAKSLQSCPTLCDPIDGSPPGSPVPGILQARTLEWVVLPSVGIYDIKCYKEQL